MASERRGLVSSSTCRRKGLADDIDLGVTRGRGTTLGTGEQTEVTQDEKRRGPGTDSQGRRRNRLRKSGRASRRGLISRLHSRRSPHRGNQYTFFGNVSPYCSDSIWGPGKILDCVKQVVSENQKREWTSSSVSWCLSTVGRGKPPQRDRKAARGPVMPPAPLLYPLFSLPLPGQFCLSSGFPLIDNIPTQAHSP